MVKALLDTNIVIDYLNGDTRALEEIKRYDSIAISIITYIEVLVGVPQTLQDRVKSYLESLHIVDVSKAVATQAIDVRQRYHMKIPDALILASAQHIQALCVTRDTKDFDTSLPSVRVPYKG